MARMVKLAQAAGVMYVADHGYSMSAPGVGYQSTIHSLYD